MKRRDLYLKYRIKDVVNKLINRKSDYHSLSAKLGNKHMLSAQEANDLIREAIEKNTPFFAGRYGGFELAATIKHIEHRLNIDSNIVSNLENNAGFFNTTNLALKEFAELNLKSSEYLDLVGRHWNGMEDYIIRAYAKQANITEMFSLEPWFPSVVTPWTMALEGKKVLVIHPFVTSIQHQYRKKEQIFENKLLLPEFELKTIKAVQTIAGIKDQRFGTWFEALESMHQAAKKIDYDVAIIGCGAYGFPLSAMLKNDGKVVVHLGGATQILFGIKGRRWMETLHFDYVKKLFNDNWIYPMNEDQVSNARIVEGGCYWGNEDEQGV